MSLTAEKLISEALNMPTVLRAFIAERIIESLDRETNEPLSPEWKAEIEKRCREIDENLVSLLDAEEVFNRAYATLQ